MLVAVVASAVPVALPAFAIAFAASVAFALVVALSAFLIAFATLASAVTFALGLSAAIGGVLVIALASLAICWGAVITVGITPWLLVELHLIFFPEFIVFHTAACSFRFICAYLLLGVFFLTLSSTRRMPLAAIPLILSFRISTVQLSPLISSWS
jgi:hypothetical protein